MSPLDRSKPRPSFEPEAPDITSNAERGTANLEQRDAPPDHRRPVLEVQASTPSTGDTGIRSGHLTLTIDEPAGPGGGNPYDHTPGARAQPKTVKRDLRKLSEWIKMTRALQLRKQRGED